MFQGITCSKCSSWSDSTWKLAEQRTYTSRKWVMSKKKKRSQAMSDSSYERKNYGSTTPHGPAARGKTHKGGNSKGTQGSISPPVIGQLTTGQPATGHSPSGQENITDRSSPVTGHWPPVKWALRKNFLVSQSPVTGRPATGHWTENFNTGKSVFTGHQSTGHRSLVIRLYISL